MTPHIYQETVRPKSKRLMDVHVAQIVRFDPDQNSMFREQTEVPLES